MENLTVTHWALLMLGALIMGMSKGGIPGAGNLTVAIFVLVMEDALGPVGVPLSVGLLLPVLISADVAATGVYRRHADWKYIIRLLPCFLIGTMLGWWVFDYFQGGDHRVRQLKVLIGLILLSMTALHFILQARKEKASETPPLDESPSQNPPKDQSDLALCLARSEGWPPCLPMPPALLPSSTFW